MASIEGDKAKESNMQFVVSKQNLQKGLSYVAGSGGNSETTSHGEKER